MSGFCVKSEGAETQQKRRLEDDESAKQQSNNAQFEQNAKKVKANPEDLPMDLRDINLENIRDFRVLKNFDLEVLAYIYDVTGTDTF